MHTCPDRLHLMHVFITGGAGFIGSHLCDALLKEGHQVSILDNMSTGSAANIAHIKDQIEIHQGDIRDQALVEPLVEKCDLVLHMAAALGVNTILEKTIESVSVNFTGSEVVLNAGTFRTSGLLRKTYTPRSSLLVNLAVIVRTHFGVTTLHGHLFAHRLVLAALS